MKYISKCQKSGCTGLATPSINFQLSHTQFKAIKNHSGKTKNFGRQQIVKKCDTGTFGSDTTI
jgi:hypothetical protein